MSAFPPMAPLPDAPPPLAGARVRLRALRGDDAEALFEIFSNAEVMRYWSGLPMTTLDEARALVLRANASALSHDGLQWAIARIADDRAIGTVTLFRFHAQNRRAEIGYAIGRAHWGQGLASEALTLTIRYAFETLQLQRIEADIDPRNAPSERILLRQGFKPEGLLRERWIVGDEVSDSRLLGLLRREWTAAYGSS